MQLISSPRFATREDAGRRLASRLKRHTSDPNSVVLALPKGAVSVGRQIATALNIPFDILLVSHITSPLCGQEPLGAITGGGVRMLNFALIDRLHLRDADVRNAILHGALRLARRERLYRGHRPSIDVADHTVILADDGTSSCESLCTAMRLLRRQHVDRVIVATPAACRHAACDLRMEADEVVTLAEADEPGPAETWFQHFPRPSFTETRHLVRDQVC